MERQIRFSFSSRWVGVWKNATWIKLSLIHHYNIHANDLCLGTHFYPCILGKYAVYKRKDKKPKDSTDPKFSLSLHLLNIGFLIILWATICIIISKNPIAVKSFWKMPLKRLRISLFEIPMVRVNHISYGSQLSSVQLQMFSFNPPGSPLLLPTHFVGKENQRPWLHRMPYSIFFQRI